MRIALFILCAAWAAAPLLILAAIVSVARDNRRERRAAAAGDEAVTDLRRQRQAADDRPVVPVRIELAPADTRDRWRWLVWDAEPVFPEQIDGVLVPYALGFERTRDLAEAAARASAYVQSRARVVEVVIREPEYHRQ